MTEESSEKLTFFRRHPEISRWLFALVLLTPAYLLYLVHFTVTDGNIATGFIHSDLTQYMGFAREHFDNGFDLLYRNPFSSNYNDPPIYFHAQIFLLGLIQWITGADPGAVFVAFGFVVGVLFARTALLLYETYMELRSLSQWIGAVLLLWGGGALVAAGVVSIAASGGSLGEIVYLAGKFDPGGGWWMLSLGRNVLFPLEAYYHVVVFLAFIFAIRGRYLVTAALMLLAALSHPFTAVILLTVMGMWCLIEHFYIRNDRMPLWMPVYTAVLTLVFLLYYLVVLPALGEKVVGQYGLDWTMKAVHFVPAYALVALFAIWTMRRPDLALTYLSEPRHRLALVWFLVVFALANHEFALSHPMQPIHYTRGYVWTPLFLMGLPSIVDFLDFLRRRLNRVVGVVATSLVIVLFLSDNIYFFGIRYMASFVLGQPSVGVYMKPTVRELYDWMDQSDEFSGYVVVADSINPVTGNNEIGYHSAVYTPLRPWSAHYVATPDKKERDAELKLLFEDGIVVDALRKTPMLAVFRRRLFHGEPAWVRGRHGRQVFTNADFIVYQVPPEGGS